MLGRKSKTRKERKKKKLVAFLEVAKLNEIDAKKKMKRDILEEKITSPMEGNCDASGPSKKFKGDMSLKNILSTGQSDDEEVPDLSRISYSDLSLEELKKARRERMDKLKKLPKFRLKEKGEMASFDTSEDERVPLFMVDIQHLIMVSLLGHHAPFDAPRWYQLQKFNKISHTTVLVVDDVSLEDLNYANGFLHLSPTQEDQPHTSVNHDLKLFPWRLELVGPSTYGSNLIQEMTTIPLSNTQYDKLIKRFGSIEEALKGKAVYKVFRAIFPISELEGQMEAEGSIKSKEGNEDVDSCDEDDKKGAKKKNKDKFPRTQLLLSANQMVEIGYPLPLMKCSSSCSAKQPVIIHTTNDKLADSLGSFIQSPDFVINVVSDEEKKHVVTESDCEKNEKLDDELYVLSRPWYKEVGPNSPLFAIDCEMCMTGKQKFELTRISVVDEDLNVVYETYVKPFRKITNYLTRFSGITPKHLKNVETRLSDVQRDLRKLLPPDAILVGQSLNFDLHAMKMMHPYVIDTSIAFNLTGQRLKRSKLATLSRLFLSEEIQCWGSKGHDSIEDAAAAMKLVLLKLSKSPSYGDAVLEGRLKIKEKREPRKVRLANDLGSRTDPKDNSYATSIFSHVKRGQHTAVVVGVKEVIDKYQEYVEEGLYRKEKEAITEDAVEDNAAKLIPVEHTKEIIGRACEVMLDHQLCIVHLTRECVGEKLKKLEKWCRKIVQYSAENSLCLVILGGAQSANGACLIHLKRPEYPSV